MIKKCWKWDLSLISPLCSLLSVSLILILYSNLLHCYLFIICIPRKFNVKWFCNNLSIRTRIGKILMRKISGDHSIGIVSKCSFYIDFWGIFGRILLFYDLTFFPSLRNICYALKSLHQYCPTKHFKARK